MPKLREAPMRDRMRIQFAEADFEIGFSLVDMAEGEAIHGNYARNSQLGLQGAELANLSELFRGVYGQVDAHAAAHPEAEPDLLKETAKKVEDEAAKGENADPGRIERALTTLAKLAPDVLEIAVNALTNPGAAVASGVRLVAERVKAQFG